MNRVILGSVIVGIAVMMSMGIVPAQATTPVDANCTLIASQGIMKCDVDLVEGDHVVIHGSGNMGVCHFNLEEQGNTNFWIFFLDEIVHGNECLPNYGIAKVNVTTR